MAYFSVSKDSEASWFFDGFWNGNGDEDFTATAINTSSENRIFKGVYFTFLVANSGGRSFAVAPSGRNTACGAGCKMYCKVQYPNGVTSTSNTVDIPPSYSMNMSPYADWNDPWYEWFMPRPGPGYNFIFSNPQSMSPNQRAKITFIVSSWGYAPSSGNNCIQVSQYDTMSEPTTVFYDVTFNLAGGARTGGGALNQSIEEGHDATPPTCTKPGSRFIGWSGSYTDINSNRTITAIWEDFPIWRWNGSSWEKIVVSKKWNGRSWNETPTMEFDDSWKKQ